MPKKYLNIQFLDVGQGDGIFITFPNGKTMLVDLGSNKNKHLTSTDVFKYFTDHTRFDVLDYLILTHGDGDHYNLVKKFRDTFKPTIANLLYGGRESDYKGLIAGLNTTQVMEGKSPIKVVMPAGRFPFELNSRDYFGGVEVVVLAMDVPGTSNSSDAWRKNTSSVVLRLEYAEQGVVLSGDATFDTERFIVTTLAEARTLSKLKSTVLKVAHHGSARTSIAPKWIQSVKPEFIFISSDRSGSLSEKDKTGHRLPQQLAIDIIDANTKLFQVTEHTYVSSYDPDDYTGYTDPETRDVGFKNPHEDTEAEWRERKTWVQFSSRQAIFTTLAAMDLKSADDSEADQGVQYELTISDSGDVNVTST